MKSFFRNLIITVVLLEIVLRIYNPLGFRVRGNEIVLLRNKHFVIKNEKTDKLDNPILHSKNSLGFRGDELPPRPEDFIKIVTIGGSTTEGFYLSDGKTWPDRLGEQLKQIYPNLWINNAGLDGHSTFGHMILLRDYVVKIKPDVAIFLLGINDIERSDLSDLDKANLKHGIRLDSLKNLVRSAADYSEIFSLGLNLYRTRIAGEIVIRHKMTDFGNPEYVQTPDAIRVEMLNRQQPYLSDYKIRLENLVRFSKEHHIKPVLVTQPAVYGFGEDEITGADLARIKISENVDGETGWKILEMYNMITRRVAQEQDVILVDLAQHMPKDSRYYYDLVHFSNEGAIKVANILYSDEHFRDFLLLPR